MDPHGSIVVMGEAYLDLRAESHFRPGISKPGSRLDLGAGGNAYWAALALRRADVPVRFALTAGTTELSRLLVARIQTTGAEVQVCWRAEAAPAWRSTHLDAQGRPQSQVTSDPDRRPWPAAWCEQVVTSCSGVVLDSTLPPSALRHVSRLSRARECPVWAIIRPQPGCLRRLATIPFHGVLFHSVAAQYRRLVQAWARRQPFPVALLPSHPGEAGWAQEPHRPACPLPPPAAILDSRQAAMSAAHCLLPQLAVSVDAWGEPLREAWTELLEKGEEAWIRDRSPSLDQYLDHLREDARRDALTGLWSRGAGERELARLLGAGPAPMALILLDVDRFKQVNDGFGHATGDRILQEIATLLQNGFRQGQPVIRWGGEEFLCALPGADAVAAGLAAERLRKLVARTIRRPDGQPVTISGGIAGIRPGETLAGAVARADQTLYRAKATGRNRIERE